VTKNDSVFITVVITTYNRKEMLSKLLLSCNNAPDCINFVVHDDASTDGTDGVLKKYADNKRFVIYRSSVNLGQGASLTNAIRLANGRYTMTVNDDDIIYFDELERVIELIKSHGQYACRDAYILDLKTPNGDRLHPFNKSILNFMSLRFDLKIRGDKEELVRTDILQNTLEKTVKNRYVPPSLYWFRVALKYDAVVLGNVIGEKRYESDGLTHSINKLIRDNPRYYLKLQATCIRGYLAHRYRSLSCAFKSVVKIFKVF